MDRFIDGFGVTKFNSILCLKSNMDRFIAHTPSGYFFPLFSFKIQYGQIYRSLKTYIGLCLIVFKIQYGQIYRFHLPSVILSKSWFRIQYGQIYSQMIHLILTLLWWFKIQYGQIYSGKIFLHIPFLLSLKSNMDRFIDLKI